MKKSIILIILLTQSFMNAQDLLFEHYNEINGLSHNSVRSIVQDTKGFLWLGTFGGLNRFDGYDFKVYNSQVNNTSYLQDDDIVAMGLDKANNLWIGTNNGLTRHNIITSTFKTYHYNSKQKNSLIDNRIRSVYIDHSARLWIGTKDNGLCYFNYKNELFYKIKIKNVENIRAIYQTKDGKIWFSTFSNGIFSFNIDNQGVVSNIKNYDLSYSNLQFEKNPECNFLIEDKKNDFFVGTKNGLFKLNKVKNKLELVAQKNNELDYFRCITIGPKGDYWIGTLNGIIECKSLEDISKDTYKRHIPDLKNSNSLVNNYIISLFFDKSEILWIGTENGLDKYDPFVNQFKILTGNFATNNKLPIVSCFGKTYDKKLIVGTNSNGLFLRENNKYVQILKKYSKISTIYSTDGKIFYIGLWDGKMLKYNYLNNTDELLDVGFKKGPVLSFFKNTDDTVLIGSFGEGMVEFNSTTKKHRFIREDVLKNQAVNKIIATPDHTIWLATEEGIFKYNSTTNKIRNYSSNVRDGLSNNMIKDLIIDAKGVLWVGTRQGLNYYDARKDKFVVEGSPVELKNIWVTDIAIDSSGVMWLNMNYNKIGRYNKKTKEVRIFYVNNGVRSNIVNNRGFFFYENSTIYLGGDKEIIYFSPSKIIENKWSPSPIITEFKVQNKEVLPGVEIEGQLIVKEDLNYAKSVDLNYNNRNFSITFSAPSYAKERLNKFQYKLVGLDNDWINVNSNSRTIQYTNLYPKKYILKIRSSNNNGYWSPPVSYNINILPPFWMTYKAFLLLLILVSVLIFFVRKQIKVRSKLKHELLLEKVKRDHEEKLSNEKLLFFTNISHELRTPLTLILGPVKQLMEQGNGTDYEKAKVNLIYQNANRLLLLVNQILDFRKAQSGELKLKVSKTEILANTQNIFNSFVQFAEEKTINFNLNCENEVIEGWIDIDKYDKILYNLLSNALKFTNSYGNVDLFIGVEEGIHKKLIIEVSDDGVGIPIESQEKVFSRFYQVKSSKKNNTGSGIGLSLVKSLVSIHKGKISLQSAPNKGSVFTLELPISKDSFKKNEIFDFVPNGLNMPELAFDKTKKVNNNTDIKQSILVIEDNVELRLFLIDYLSDFYIVHGASNGEEGLNICRKIKPVLCVVDVMMPVMDGFHFVEEIKNDENISHTPVIMLTALSENESKIKGYALGVDGYLVKPFDPSLLKTRIDNIIKTRFELKQKFSGEVESDISSLTHSQIDIEFISKVKELIELNIDDVKLTTNFLCIELAMSSSKLYRKIKQLTDLSPNEFIKTLRLKKSAQLLKTKNYNVSEVAEMVGFSDPLYFSKCFKIQFGHSPSSLTK
ncbi:two-component regulator propeller domain-containing protein [Flavobacterium sp. LT1R49]|uniref:two-component regulator propeller domain-containing protein n=1 Tax=Flavobacterium arabinosi TaxID=3398737 RepID=UPI003A848FEF